MIGEKFKNIQESPTFSHRSGIFFSSMTRQDLKMYICILNIVVKENLVIIVIECLYNTFKKCQDQNQNPNTYVEKKHI